MDKKFKQWILKNCTDEVFYFVLIQDTLRELQILLENSKQTKRLKIIFRGHLTYRMSDEGDRLNFLKHHSEVCTGHSFFYTTKSEFLSWFYSESFNIREKDGIVHYLITTPNEIFEVLSVEGEAEIFYTLED